MMLPFALSFGSLLGPLVQTCFFINYRILDVVQKRKQNVIKSDSRGEVKSRFSHVRKLIKEDPSLGKKRKKKEK